MQNAMIAAHLLWRNAREAEHANLLSDVLPGQAAAGFLEVVAQQRPHFNDAFCHGLHLIIPPLLDLGCAKDTVHQQSSVHRRIAVHGSCNCLQTGTRELVEIMSQLHDASLHWKVHLCSQKDFTGCDINKSSVQLRPPEDLASSNMYKEGPRLVEFTVNSPVLVLIVRPVFQVKMSVRSAYA